MSLLIRTWRRLLARHVSNPHLHHMVAVDMTSVKRLHHSEWRMAKRRRRAPAIIFPRKHAGKGGTQTKGGRHETRERSRAPERQRCCRNERQARSGLEDTGDRQVVCALDLLWAGAKRGRFVFVLTATHLTSLTARAFTSEIGAELRCATQTDISCFALHLSFLPCRSFSTSPAQSKSL